MKFAVLTPDQETRYLIEAAVRAGNIVGQTFGPRNEELFRNVAIGANIPSASIHPLNAWEELLHDPIAETVIVGNDLTFHAAGWTRRSENSERLIRLAQAAVSFVTSFPACDTLDGFQLQMIQKDTQCVIVPYFRGLYSPLAGFLKDWGRSSGNAALGALQQVSVQRFSAVTSHAQMIPLFARDATIIRRSLGKIERISALRPTQGGGDAGDDWSGVSVQMSDAEGRIAQWTLWRDTPRTEPEKVAEFVFQGSNGRLIAECKQNRPFHLIATSSQRDAAVANGVPLDPSSLELCDDLEFREILAGLKDPARATEEWENACRALELAETIEVSVRRGKTIQLFHEEHTELSTFKSVMAAGGCLTLLAILAIIPILVVVDRIFPGLANHPNLRNLPWIVVATILLVFIAIQGIITLTGAGRPEKPT